MAAADEKARKHRVPVVDWGNSYLRHLMKTYAARHKAVMDNIRRRLPAWVSAARLRETQSPPRPLAAVFDLDEVIFCNLHLGEYVSPKSGDSPAIDFHAADLLRWPRNSRLNPLLPGARLLLDAARELGLALFFVSGRPESIRDETVENFAAAGLVSGANPLLTPAELDEALTLRPDADIARGGLIRPYKEGRRREIEKTHRIVINVGDQASDLGLYSDVACKVPNEFYFLA